MKGEKIAVFVICSYSNQNVDYEVYFFFLILLRTWLLFWTLFLNATIYLSLVILNILKTREKKQRRYFFDQLILTT